jgi:hypothetical protein
MRHGFAQQSDVDLPAGANRRRQLLKAFHGLQDDFVLPGQHFDCGIRIHERDLPYKNDAAREA